MEENTNFFFQIFMSEFQILLMAKQNPTLQDGEMFKRFRSGSLGLSDKDKEELSAKVSDALKGVTTPAQSDSNNPSTPSGGGGGGTRRNRRNRSNRRKSLRAKPRKRLSRVL